MAPKSKMMTSRFVTKAAVRNMIQSQIETKRIVQTSSGTVSATGATLFYSAIAQGDDRDARSGDKVLIKSLDWTFAYADTVTGTARIMIVQDTSNSGAAPSVTEILSSATIQAHLNPTYHIQNRFKVLADQVFTTSIAGEQYVNRTGKCKVKLPVFFNGTGATSTSGGKNSIYVLVIGGQATGAYVINVDIGFTDA